RYRRYSQNFADCEFRHGDDFFFSSRRRHTRSKRDWSFRRVLFRSNGVHRDTISLARVARGVRVRANRGNGSRSRREGSARTSRRSEERRVGKEWRSWWAQYEEREKEEREDGGDVK